MKITLKYLKTKWNEKRIESMKRTGVFNIASPETLKKEKPGMNIIDAAWSLDYKTLANTRDKNKFASHVFVSQMCGMAVEEYTTVCKLLGIKTICLIGDKEFVKKSKKLLSTIPNVEIL